MKTMPISIEEKIGKLLREQGKKVSVAESCTGGLISHLITNIPGSSDYFGGGVVAYNNKSKIDILHVSQATIRKFGAVSQQTAKEMAKGIRQLFGTDLGIATTGIAGPGGGSPEKPVGLVHVALSATDKTICKKFSFDGSRREIKMKSAEAALKVAVNYLLRASKANEKN